MLFNSSNKSLLVNLLRLNSVVGFNDFNIKQFLSFLNAIFWIEFNKIIWEKVYIIVTKSTPPPQLLPFHFQTPYWHNTSSSANSSKHKKYIGDVLKKKLGPLYMGIFGLYELFFKEMKGFKKASAAIFKKCKKGNNPLYAKGS